ncbi:UNVERIFIED_CONTAM: hypothetical protein FKN15_076934 [Acipenser sinensis]
MWDKAAVFLLKLSWTFCLVSAIARRDLFPYGPHSGDSALPEGDDETSEVLTLKRPLYFYETKFSELYMWDKAAVFLLKLSWTFCLVSAIARRDLFPYGPHSGDSALPEGDDETSEVLTLKRPLYVYETKFSELYVGTNGIISPQNFPRETQYVDDGFPTDFPVITPFLADLDTSNGKGAIYYREDDSTEVLIRAAEEVKRGFPESTFSPTAAFIATWDSVGPYEELTRNSVPSNRVNTFQVVLAYDDTDTFALFLYPHKELQFYGTRPKESYNVQLELPARVGFSRGELSFLFLRKEGPFYSVTSSEQTSGTRREPPQILAQGHNDSTRSLLHSLGSVGASYPEPSYPDPSYPQASYPEPSYPDPSYPQASYPEPSYPDPSYPQASYPEPSYPDPSYPQASYPEPSYPEPSYPDPSYPQASYPEPSYPEPSYPDPSYPQASYPEPSYPEPSYPDPSYPQASYPAPSYPEPSYPQASYPDPSYPQASYPEPSYPEPSYPEPSYPQASYPEPSYPEPSYPDPSYPQASYPEPSYPDPSYPQASYPEPSYPEPSYPEPSNPQPREADVQAVYPGGGVIPLPESSPPHTQGRSVVSVDEDVDVDAGVFVYNTESRETCAQFEGRCSRHAYCSDYSWGFCCHCQSGYYGNGRHCLPDGVPHRVNGKVSGRVLVGATPVDLGSVDLHAYVVVSDGRAYTAVSHVPEPAGWALMPLSPIGGLFGWLFALELTGHENGFSITDMDECAEGLSSCGSHSLCVNLQGSHRCECQSGYHFTVDGRTCIDIDECASPRCDPHATCFNTPGSFHCRCVPGYKGDGFQCLASPGLLSPEGLAVDYLRRSMFWVDSGLDKIEAARLDGTERRVLFDTDLVNPRAIAVDPRGGNLYWTDWNREGPKIETSTVDGANRRVLVKDDIGLPNALTFDPLRKQLCWADAGTKRLECAQPDGTGRHVIHSNLNYPFSLVSYSNHFYYTDWRRDGVMALSRDTSQFTDEYLPDQRSHLYGITVAYPRCASGKSTEMLSTLHPCFLVQASLAPHLCKQRFQIAGSSLHSPSVSHC